MVRSLMIAQGLVWSSLIRHQEHDRLNQRAVVLIKKQTFDTAHT